MPESDLDLLNDAARNAGEIARRYFEGTNKVWQKDGQGPVTEADLSVDTYLSGALRAARPEYGWLSEESGRPEDRAGRRRLFVVDPIDGTRAFVAGERTWAHSIAVVEDGTPVAAVVYLPMKGLLYSAVRGAGAMLNGDRIHATGSLALPGARILAARPTLDGRHWPNGVPALERHFRPSLAYRLSLVGQGRFDGMITFRDSWEWDIAAGSLIAEEAGATVTDRSGGRLAFNNPHPVTHGVIAASPAVHSNLMHHLTDPEESTAP